jgi:hypothetical protein
MSHGPVASHQNAEDRPTADVRRTVIAARALSVTVLASGLLTSCTTTPIVPAPSVTSIPHQSRGPIPSSVVATGASDSPNATLASHSPSTGLVAIVPRPTGVALTIVPQAEKTVLEVTWSGPLSSGVTMRVFGITKCLGKPDQVTADQSGLCLTDGMSLPASAERGVASGPAASGFLRWTWRSWGDIGGALAFDATTQTSYYGFVVRASEAGGGNSVATIASSAGWCDCTY